MKLNNGQVSTVLGAVIAILVGVVNQLSNNPSGVVTVAALIAAVLSGTVNYFTTKLAAPIVAVVPAPVEKTAELPAQTEAK